MRYLAALLVALLAVCAVYAGSTVVIMRPAAAASCSSQSSLVSTNAEYNEVSINTIWYTGESWTAPSAATLYSITVNISTVGSPTGTLTLRHGPSANLTSSYTEATSGAITATGDVEFIFPAGSRPTVSSSTTYYFMVTAPSASSTNYKIWADNRNPYAGGVMIRSFDNGWDGSGYSEETTDVDFTVKKCD